MRNSSQTRTPSITKRRARLRLHRVGVVVVFVVVAAHGNSFAKSSPHTREVTFLAGAIKVVRLDPPLRAPGALADEVLADEGKP